MFRANIDLIYTFRQWLNDKQYLDCHRSMVVINASRQTLRNLCDTLVNDYPTSLLVSENIVIDGKSISSRSINSQLGNEYTNVIFDARHDFSASALYAASGLVGKSGNFILLAPPQNRWPELSAKYNKQLSYGDSHAKSLFVVKFIHTLRTSSRVSWLCPRHVGLRQHELVEQGNKSNRERHSILENSLSINDTVKLNKDQNTIFETIKNAIQKGTPTKYIVLGKRGRGKSTLLAYIALYATSQNLRIRYTANLKRNCYAIASLLNANKNSKQSAEFIPPDQAALCIETITTTDLLIVDEVASIAPDLIKIILKKYRFVVMAGTYDGYEGSGMGLIQRLIPSITDLKHYQLSRPLRWHENDPIEGLLTTLFSPNNSRAISQNGFEPTLGSTGSKEHCTSLHIRKLEKKELIDNPALYDEAVHLLTSAHYQTTPNDIKRILDESSYQLIAAFIIVDSISTIVGLMVCVEEGGFDDRCLSIKIAEGKRRVKGHLFAQSMALYVHSCSLLTFKYLRVQRIAVVENFRREGIGSKLLEFGAAQADRNKQIICSNFGLTDPLVKFWSKNKFVLIKIGQKIDSASGTLSGFFLQEKIADNTPFPFPSLQLKLNLEFAFIRTFKPNILERVPLLIKSAFEFELRQNRQIDDYLKSKLHRLSIGSLQIEQLLPECYYLSKVCKVAEYEKYIFSLVSKGISKEEKIESSKILIEWIKKTRF